MNSVWRTTPATEGTIKMIADRIERSYVNKLPDPSFAVNVVLGPEANIPSHVTLMFACETKVKLKPSEVIGLRDFLNTLIEKELPNEQERPKEHHQDSREDDGRDDSTRTPLSSYDGPIRKKGEATA